jgi:outer membrane receptor protein involved in Fe transport
VTDRNADLPPSSRRLALLRASLAPVLACALAVPAAAQDAGPPPEQGAQAPVAPDTSIEANAADQQGSPASSDIIVTGSRIQSSGFSAPTPTTVIGEEQIAQNAQPNVFTTIAQLPSLQGSTGVTTGTNSTSSGTQGLSSFSLRGLGTIRTLTLLDGQRVVGANVTGVPDISQFPQLLIERVDVVTGGASASYGSDAVGGVVNFITNKRFTGIKGNLQGGITTYGDDESVLAQLAIGRSFADDRLHVIVSGEYAHEEGIGPGGFGEDAPEGRDWYTTATIVNRGITNDGRPQYNYREHAQAYQYTLFGLINNGPLQGTAFDKNGQPFQFQYGSSGVPTRNTTGNVTGCYVGFCVGGDLSGNVGIGTTLKSRLDRYNGYGRIGFDIDADNEIYATVNISQVDTSNQPNPGAAQTSLTMRCDNPFLPGSVAALCPAGGTFGYGVSNAILPNIQVFPSRKQYRFVAGANGKVEAFGNDWRYDAYFEHGENITDITVKNMLIPRRYQRAIDATRDASGTIVCRDPVARANGCVPINIFGGNPLSAAALTYLQPENGPFQHTRQTQDVASANLSGDPFSTWAGSVSIATGLEWRREFYHVTADPYGNGTLTGATAYNSDYPADPLFDNGGGNWYAGNYRVGRGSYTVFESYLELNVPVLNDPGGAGTANLNVAGRATNYSTSGTVYTWKVGGTWDTPLDGLRLRAVTSRDVRAPNLSELFAAPISVNVPNFTNPFTNPPSSVNISQNTIGNSSLVPETARNTEVGVVLSRPQWLPGLSLSFDYYNIKISDVISTLTPQQIVNYCRDGVTELCGAFVLDRPGGIGNFVNVQPFNLASIKTEGFDIEASYQWRQPVGLPGTLTARALATHVIRFVTDTGLPGTVPIDTAGVNSGATPSWKWLTTQTYAQDEFSILLQQRWFPDGVFGSQYVVCDTNCPVSTANSPTIDYNTMKGPFYFDVGGTYNINAGLSAYFKVDNVFDRDPTPSPQTNTGIDVNPQLYDIMGRVFRVGVRFKF